MSKKRGWERPKLKTVISPLAAIALVAQEDSLSLFQKTGYAVTSTLIS